MPKQTSSRTTKTKKLIIAVGILLLVTFTFVAGTYLLLLQMPFGENRVTPTRQLTSPTPRINQVPDTSPTPFVPYQAQFAIYTNGIKRTFTASMYHQLSEKAFIEPGKPDFVQVHAPNVSWQDFFATLPFQVTSNCLITGTGQRFCSDQNQSLKFYLNGQTRADILSQTIQPNDKLVISFGPINDSQLQQQISQ